ncbi:hypothetical protein LY625_09260 [Lysobacter sp. GX 14042]|uniref:hypothetical protein n=1 Tax=Lysobacter sp. GX 14042 TaxID=2907155 RepID=UPI001F24F48C|nr:hypothetical protein [Lysobacter sp. GX 14042]MCE7032796.1 hypothetical protein [Lysobacter sp. GX 14042]
MTGSVTEARLPYEAAAAAGRARLLHAAAALLLVAAAAGWATAIRPQPFSDWLYYWEAARGAIAYERGGIMLFVLRVLQKLPLAPYAVMLLINLASALVILAIAYRADGRRIGLASALVYAYLLAITPYFAVVQFDLSATALLCAGFGFLALDAPAARRPWVILAATLLVAGAVSSRPQFLLVLLVFAALLGTTAAMARAALFTTRRPTMLSALVLMVGALLGFAGDSALRAQAGRSEAVRTNSGVTLYAGLLSSGTSPPTCGHWSLQAMRDARADAHLPLQRAVSTRLRQQPPGHWLEVMRCKAGMIVFPEAYALSWSLGAPDVVDRLAAVDGDTHLQATAAYLYRIEDLGYRVLLVLIYAFALAAVVRSARKGQWLPAMLPLFWLASFWLVHAIFEIQARYFLSLFVVLPLMAVSSTHRNGNYVPRESAWADSPSSVRQS